MIFYNIIFLSRRQTVVLFLVLSHIFTLRTPIDYAGLLKEHNTSWNGRNSSFMQVFFFARYISSWKLQKFCCKFNYQLWRLTQECQGAVLWAVLSAIQMRWSCQHLNLLSKIILPGWILKIHFAFFQRICLLILSPSFTSDSECTLVISFDSSQFNIQDLIY